MIIDTDVLVWEFRGNNKARDIIRSCIPFKISVVTYMELVQGMRNRRELNKFTRQLANWKVQIIHLESFISIRAMLLIEEFFLSHSLELADALIAATCIHSSEKLLTANEKHYNFIPNIQLEKFKP